MILISFDEIPFHVPGSACIIRIRLCDSPSPVIPSRGSRTCQMCVQSDYGSAYALLISLTNNILLPMHRKIYD